MIVRLIVLFFSVLLLCLCGCSSRPVLYPNEYYRKVGDERAQNDIDLAIHKAGKLGIEEKTSRNHQQLAKSMSDSAVDCGTQSAMGAVNGGVGISGISSMVAGGTKAFVRWLFWSTKPNMHYRKFVNSELIAKGYKVTGWQ